MQILVFKQAEKAMLRIQGYVDTLTVHEYQGKQSKKIALYRDSVHEADVIYKSLPHVLVAMTRHSEQFTYYTRLLNDNICRIIDVMKQMSSSEFFRELRPRNTIQGDPTGTFNELVMPREMSARMVGAAVLSVSRDSHYFENTIMRSNGYNVPRVQYISGEMYTPTVIAKRLKAPKLKANIAALQSWIHILMPGCNHHDTTYDDMQLHHSPFELQLTNKVAFDIRSGK